LFQISILRECTRNVHQPVTGGRTERSAFRQFSKELVEEEKHEERIIDFHFVLFALMAVSPLSVASAGLVRFGWIDPQDQFLN
jgi:hypothetical protein